MEENKWTKYVLTKNDEKQVLERFLSRGKSFREDDRDRSKALLGYNKKVLGIELKAEGKDRVIYLKRKALRPTLKEYLELINE